MKQYDEIQNSSPLQYLTEKRGIVKQIWHVISEFKVSLTRKN